MKPGILLILGFIFITTFGNNTVFAQSELDTMSLEKISQKLENPLTNLWSLTFQENFSILTGSLSEQNQYGNNFFFQPFMPFPIASKYMITFRPVFPLVTSPVLIQEDSIVIKERKTGLGDIQLLTLFGPGSGSGIIWGAGITTRFPSATAEALGEGKWQAGPAAMFFYIKKPYTTGLLVQHWVSYAGDPDRPETNLTNIQYVFRYGLPKAWSIGMGPTIAVNWEREKGNRVTLPIGLGITKTVRWGKTPFKLRVEPQYSLIKPDDLGTEWNIRLQITPVIKRPGKRKH